MQDKWELRTKLIGPRGRDVSQNPVELFILLAAPQSPWAKAGDVQQPPSTSSTKLTCSFNAPRGFLLGQVTNNSLSMFSLIEGMSPTQEACNSHKSSSSDCENQERQALILELKAPSHSQDVPFDERRPWRLGTKSQCQFLFSFSPKLFFKIYWPKAVVPRLETRSSHD